MSFPSRSGVSRPPFLSSRAPSRRGSAAGCRQRRLGDRLRALTRLGASLLAAAAFAQAEAATGNKVKGAELFGQCAACHAVGQGAEHGVGPTLNHLFGRRAGSLEDYEYSEAMREAGVKKDIVWDEESLYYFVAGPERYLPGTKMAFAGLRTEQELKDLLAFLIDFSPAYVPGSGEEVGAEAIAATAPLPVHGAEDEEEVPDFDAAFLISGEAIALGGELWAKQCRHCHGNSAYPGKAPKLKPAGYEPEFVFDRITNGFRKMPAWKSVFSLDERKGLVAYVLSDEFSP